MPYPVPPLQDLSSFLSAFFPTPWRTPPRGVMRAESGGIAPPPPPPFVPGPEAGLERPGYPPVGAEAGLERPAGLPWQQFAGLASQPYGAAEGYRRPVDPAFGIRSPGGMSGPNSDLTAQLAALFAVLRSFASRLN